MHTASDPSSDSLAAALAGQGRSREFPYTRKDFEWVRRALHQHAGIELAEHKKDMVYNRLVGRLRALSLKDFEAYARRVESDPVEFGEFINAMTTNLTAFFREQHHFDFLGGEYLNQCRARGQRRLRIWSAGCSMGEEPYSIAMTLIDALGPELPEWDIRILASDIDSRVLQTAQAGVYSLERISKLDKAQLSRHFLRGTGHNTGRVRIKPGVQALVQFRQINLMEPLPVKGPVDLIFCRNVMIYFNNTSQAILLERFADVLDEQGILIVGHSESPYRLTHRLRLSGNTIYRKVV
ncbi:protein-glutamate O-methyltransferase CheR [Marinobacterium sp. AK62]|uniref:Chemotaxis protein methyltransferase n=1 Tax=Marinobacterium alkalitolerans TaxID=1542925 RepID=A0ABS3ZCL0_9GAMM|nr:protein-glutamate O-methyltransferase CheR [Marinobacterium alkalitolerans]MBP0049427.1 protein-glutamate O-methyltransferase CheR [Marinobacterium alkalitolerans]